MDLAKSLGIKRPIQGKPEIICEYRLWCPKCGDKSASWTIDGPDAKYHVKDSFERQKREVMFPVHAEHGTFTIIHEKSYPYVEMD